MFKTRLLSLLLGLCCMPVMLAAAAEPTVTQPRITYQEHRAVNLQEETFKKHLGPQDPERLKALTFLGLIALREDEQAKAQSYFQQSLALNAAHPPMNQLYYFEALGGMGISYMNQLRYSEGKKYFTRAFEVAQSLPPVTHSMVGELYAHYGESLLSSGYLDEAKATINKALQLDSRCSLALALRQSLDQFAERPDYYEEQKEIIRWADDKRVIQVYVASATDIPDGQESHLALAKKALTAWENALRRRIRFEIVSDPNQSDVVIHWVNHAMVENGETVMGFANEIVKDSYIWSKDITISLHDDKGHAASSEMLYSALLHETGHMLGISDHSPFAGDIMSPTSASTVITARDIATFNQIYETEPSYTNPPQMTLAQYRFNHP